ncbi:MAG TPA: adenylyl-sulfate kinase [Burkholderiaceae bacterium]|nr:adenylyl-sulfate kinase [Burkholderiaceae bacterium]
MSGTIMGRSANVTWYEGRLSRQQRWHALGACGATVWITGLPASGKSTLAAALEERLVELGRWAYLLDGDNLRHGVSSDLGFSEQDRRTNICRIGEIAALFADAGAVAVAALVSPFEAERCSVRERHERNGLNFVEVFIDTPLETCASRDPKGLYARARAGEIHNFTGVDDPYEPPIAPDLRVTEDMTVAAAVDAVLELLPTNQKGTSE